MIIIEGMEVNAYDLELSEIEAILNISTVQDFNLDKPYKKHDDLNEFVEQVQYLKQLSKDPSYIVSIYGYKLVDDNQYINLYYNVRTSN